MNFELEDIVESQRFRERMGEGKSVGWFDEGVFEGSGEFLLDHGEIDGAGDLDFGSKGCDLAVRKVDLEIAIHELFLDLLNLVRLCTRIHLDPDRIALEIAVLVKP